MAYWSTVLSLFLSVSLFAKTVSFQSGGRAEATLTSSLNASRDTEEPSSVLLDFQLPGINLETNADGFSLVAAKNLFPLGAVGNPDVSVTGSLFAVPRGFRAEIRVLESLFETIPHTVLAPTQHRVRCDCPENKSFRFNSAFYESGALFPESLVALEEVGKLQNIRLARVRIFPIQQDFGKKELKVATSLKIEVQFIPDPQDSSSDALSPMASDLISSLTPNGEELKTRARSTSTETLVIFTYDEYREALKPFIEWKQLRGFDVKVFTLSEVGGTKEKAKAFLQNLYNESAVKPSYLLIVGNKVTFPAFTELTTTGAGNQNAITDYPYSLLSGNDPIPDLMYGRFLVSNRAELETLVRKLVAYEKNPEVGNWYSSGTTIASNEPHTPSPGELSDKGYALGIQEVLKKHAYKEMDSFFQGEKTARESSILSAVESGRSWITYIGHGSGISWGSVNDQFSIYSIARLKNTRHPFLVDVACENANFSKHEKPFGKAWMDQVNDGKPAGAVGYYGGSVSISWHPPAIMATGIAKAHFEKPIHSVGGSVLAGQLYLIEQKGATPDTLDNLRWYNLFTDPTLLLRTESPKEVVLERGYDSTTDQFQVRVVADQKAVEGAVVSVIVGNGEIISTKTSEYGMASIPFAERITVSGYNLQTLETLVD